MTPLALAYAIAARWPDRIPHHDEVRKAFGVSRATAFRHIALLRESRGYYPDPS